MISYLNPSIGMSLKQSIMLLSKHLIKKTVVSWTYFRQNFTGVMDCLFLYAKVVCINLFLLIIIFWFILLIFHIYTEIDMNDVYPEETGFLTSIAKIYYILEYTLHERFISFI